jgi:hypothetical protein
MLLVLLSAKVGAATVPEYVVLFGPGFLVIIGAKAGYQGRVLIPQRVFQEVPALTRAAGRKNHPVKEIREP